MPANRAVIDTWLDELYNNANYTHMIVKCDTYVYKGHPDDQCCYPIYVTLEGNVRLIDNRNTDRTMEVYSANHSREEQMAPGRTLNYD